MESTPRPDDTPSEATATEVAPVRPTWNAVVPTSPWCPDEWREHLERLAPGLPDGGQAAAVHEATGVHLRAAPWSLLLSSRRGRLHAHRGEHREDAGHLVHFPDGWCAAIADGAGSAAYSRLGSALATHTVTHALREALAPGSAPAAALGPAMRQAAQAVHDRQRAFATQAGLAPRELRTTLLVAARHGRTLAVMQVGDGAMAVLHNDGTLSHPQAVATGDYSGEVAHFLPDDGALDVLQTSVRLLPADNVAAVLLASDGVEDPWYPFTRFAKPLMQLLATGRHAALDAAMPASFVPAWTDSVLGAADPVHALAEWLAFEKRGENDDRTLCLAYTDAFVATAGVRPAGA
ncbi:PP2C family serine/threonine-protein phosphatase [Gemmatimonas sp.]|uniref:PP2C family serine/threonine-protein phosphatase n=1 Tax=Gemmatimonas sp. TaxID=1962908 RepID=UPI0025BEFE74|nr:PP2C family serine/threonine-protein phosphatase [Gemmatimonas sp.]